MKRDKDGQDAADFAQSVYYEFLVVFDDLGELARPGAAVAPDTARAMHAAAEPVIALVKQLRVAEVMSGATAAGVGLRRQIASDVPVA